MLNYILHIQFINDSIYKGKSKLRPESRNLPLKIYTENKYMWALSLAIAYSQKYQQQCAMGQKLGLALTTPSQGFKMSGLLHSEIMYYC